MTARARRIRRKEPVPAGTAVDDALAVNGLTAAITAELVLARWADAVGPSVAARSRADEVHGTTLRVVVSTSAWLQELTLMKAQLLAELLRLVGPDCPVRELQFRLGQVVVAPRHPSRRVAVVTPKPGNVSPAEIEAESGTITDDELRDVVRRVRLRHRR